MDEGFVQSLTFPLYIAYYQHPRVLEALGREARPPHPEGYEIEPFDPSLLEPVRRRPKLYREVCAGVRPGLPEKRCLTSTRNRSLLRVLWS
jgi:hypothetical protein